MIFLNSARSQLVYLSILSYSIEISSPSREYEQFSYFTVGLIPDESCHCSGKPGIPWYTLAQWTGLNLCISGMYGRPWSSLVIFGIPWLSMVFFLKVPVFVAVFLPLFYC